MNIREERATKYYTEGETKGNWSASLRMAGYSKNYSKVGGYKMLEKDSIKAAIAKAINEQEVINKLTREVVIDGIMHNIAVAELRLDSANALRGWDMLGKVEGIYAVDNAQRTEQVKLTEQQAKEAKEYAKWRLIQGLTEPQEGSQQATG